MHVDFWAATDPGRVRKVNEDYFAIDAGLGVGIVADGVGGHGHGDVAATLCCRVIREHLQRTAASDIYSHRTAPTVAARGGIEAQLLAAVREASAQVYRAATETDGKRMACTVDAIIVAGESAFSVHVGDSRTYLLRDGKAHLLTEDHSLVQEQVRRGELSADEARQAPKRSAITRAVGISPSVNADLLVFPVIPGDRILMCSDGLTAYLDASDIAELLAAGTAGAVERAVALARLRGGKDNITGMLVAIEEEDPAVTMETDERLHRLRSVDLLRSATERELQLVLDIAEFRTERPGNLLFREGDPSSDIYLMMEGQVVITQGGHHLATLNDGATFGEMALINEHRRSASALITKPAKLMVIPHHRFRQLFRQDVALAAHLLGGLVRKFADVVDKQNKQIHSSAPAK